MATVNSLQKIINSIDEAEAIRAALLLVAGLVLSRLYFRLVRRGLLNHIPRFGRSIGGWLILLLFVSAALHQLGFNLSVLLGAAGIFSVALGFAAQTSAANIISGLFVIGERSFVVGQTIQVGNHTGEVLSIDLLSVKLRTSDNRYVRIPNDAIIKTDVVNLSKFPIRRADLLISISYQTDIAHARAVLLEVARKNPLCLDEPHPQISLRGFAESAVNLEFSVWAAREKYSDMRDAMLEQIKSAFDVARIEFPFPTRTLHLVNGEAPQRLADSAEHSDDSAPPTGA
jgi:small-conductance mechanosensitive channel